MGRKGADAADQQTSLFEGEPATARLTRRELTAAYIEELRERPPVTSVAGDTDAAAEARERIAGRDVGRVYAAAARLGCAIQLVPLGDAAGRGGGQKR